MKHATAQTLVRIDALLIALRAVPGLVERKPGVFYAKGQAYLHFHEDPAGLFADAKLDSATFGRFAVNTAAEQAALLERIALQRPAPR